MAESRLANYKTLIGDAKDTIEAIQRFIEKDKKERLVNKATEETPAASINKILNSTADEETTEVIQKIIKRI